jgi:hypothetical protein
MKLINGTLRPGQVLEVLENGKIKASAPGLFSSQDQNNLPPIMPFFELSSSHANSFSTPQVGDEVWVLNMSDNPLQLYWFRKDDHITNNSKIFEEGGSENVEIICNRESGMSWATLYFSDGSGWVLRNDDSKLQIYPDGHIELGMNWPNRTINIDSKAIHLGNSEKEHPACYGDETAEVLLKLCGVLEAVGMMAKVNPYTMHLSQPLSSVSKIKNDISGIISSHVKID